MESSRRTLLTSVAVIVALGAGFVAAKLMDHRAPPAKASGEAGEGAEKGEAGEKGEAAGGAVKLTPEQTRAAGIAVVTAQLGGAADVRLSGRVEAAPDGRAAVASPVAGSVQKVLVAPGQTVTAGAPLLVIRSAEGADLRAQTVAADAEAEAARLAAARDERLLKEGVIARQDWEASHAAAVRADASAAAARARASVSGAPTASGETMVRSPIRGVVTTVQVAPGGFVAQGGAVAEVADPARVEVVFNATPETAAKVRLGGHLTVTDAEGAQVDAVIIGVAPLASNQTGASLLRARPSGPGLHPGAAVTAMIATGGAQLPTVPAEAVQSVGGRSVVFVQTPGGFTLRPVTPGPSGGGSTPIVSGLSAGERVAGRGAFLLKAELSKGDAKDED